LADTRALLFDHGVTPAISSTLRDQGGVAVNPQAATILPPLQGPGGGWGLNGSGSAPALYTSGDRAFEGPTRRGLESLNLGAHWAILSQRRNEAWPTWTLGFEARLDVSHTQDFDRSHPSANTDVGLGYHVARFDSFVLKRFRYVEPYVGLWYEQPVVKSASAFPDYRGPGALGSATGTGQRNADPMQSVGLILGTEATLSDRGERKGRFALELRGHLEGHFEGRGWSELWEVLECRKGDPAGFQSSLCFPQEDPFGLSAQPGTSDIQNYVSLGVDLGVTFEIERRVHLRAGFGVDHVGAHLITFAEPGKDKNGNGTVDPQSRDEANPLYRREVDQPGHRYQVDEANLFRMALVATFTF
jgi:hypothetical protein